MTIQEFEPDASAKTLGELRDLIVLMISMGTDENTPLYSICSDNARYYLGVDLTQAIIGEFDEPTPPGWNRPGKGIAIV